MKYVRAVPNIMIRKLNAKNHMNRMKTEGHQSSNEKSKHNSNHIDERKNKSLISKNSFDDDKKSV